jgi:phosphoglycerate kinase
VVTKSIETPTGVRTVPVGESLGEGELAVDIGAKTIEAYRAAIASAETVFWNGPMGVFEKEEFAEGTRVVARAVADSEAVSIVGGGESVEAVNQSGSADRISHISTGGGASLEFISGQSLPGIEILSV